MATIPVIVLAVVALIALSPVYALYPDEQFIEMANKTVKGFMDEIEATTRAYNKTKEEINILENLKYSLEDKLKMQNVKMFASVLCPSMSSYELKQKLISQLQTLYRSYEPKIVEAILHDALPEMYACKSTCQLNDLFQTLSEDVDLRIFELLLQSQLKFYEMQQDNHFGNSTVSQTKFFYNLYQIKQSKLYERIRGSLRQQVDRLVHHLPPALQYLLFYPNFCLMNSKYSEYIYTALGQKNLDSTSRHVWTWHERLFIDDSGHIKANIFPADDGGSSHLLVQLKGAKFNIYYYMMPETNLVAAWDLPSEPLNSIWNIEIVGNDRVVLFQDDYIMCSTNEKYNSERRIVRGHKHGSYTSKSSECQWLLGKCDRR